MMTLSGFGKLLIVLVFVTSEVTLALDASTDTQCNGSAVLDAVYDNVNKQFVRLHIEASAYSEYSAAVTASTASSAAELSQRRLDANEDTHFDDHASDSNVHLFSGPNTVEMLSVGDKEWKSIEVHCQPAGIVHRSPYEIVGYCELNSTRVPLCVQYFTLKLNDNGDWSDDSKYGLCSYMLSTTNLTSSVILQFDEPYGLAQVLYFGERGTNKLHEIKLGTQETYDYTAPNYQGLVLMIDRIVPVRSGTFIGIRIELTNDNTPNVVYHRLFSSSEHRFVGEITKTDTTAFDSNNLSRLVSFTANHDKMVISENGTSKQYQLVSALDDPIQCKNLAGPDSHYLICLAGNGLSAILVNVTNGTSQIILLGDSLIYKFGTLDEKTFYFLNMQQELSFYLIDKSSALCIGTYTIPPGANLRLLEYNSGTLSCSDHRTVNNKSNSNNEIDVFAISISIGVIFAIFVCGVGAAFGLWNIPSFRHQLGLLHKEKVMKIPPLLSDSIELDIPKQESILDEQRGGSVPVLIGMHDSPPYCQEPLKDTAPHGAGKMFVRPSFDAIPELESPPRRIGSPTTSRFVEADTVQSAVSCSEKECIETCS